MGVKSWFGGGQTKRAILGVPLSLGGGWCPLSASSGEAGR